MYNGGLNHGDISDLTSGFLFQHNGYRELKTRNSCVTFPGRNKLRIPRNGIEIRTEKLFVLLEIESRC